MARLWNATWTVGFCELSARIGQKKSFQVVRNVNMAEHRHRGSRGWHDDVQEGLERVRAVDVRGIEELVRHRAAMMYWRMKKTPNAVTRVGRMTADRWPVRPSRAIIM